MQLSTQLQEQIRHLAFKYGNGKGEDFAQECFLVLWQRPESESAWALRIARQTILNLLKREELRASAMSTSDPAFVEVCYDDRVIDVEAYRKGIKDLRLRAIVDDYVDEVKLSGKDKEYLCRHRFELDRDVRKYLKSVSAWMILVNKVEPFRRSLKKLKQETAHRSMIRAQ